MKRGASSKQHGKMTQHATRELLAEICKYPCLISELPPQNLDDQEVARFILRAAKTIFLVAQHSQLDIEKRLAEVLFYTAYESASGPLEDGHVKALSFEGGASPVTTH